MTFTDCSPSYLYRTPFLVFQKMKEAVIGYLLFEIILKHLGLNPMKRNPLIQVRKPGHCRFNAFSLAALMKCRGTDLIVTFS